MTTNCLRKQLSKSVLVGKRVGAGRQAGWPSDRQRGAGALPLVPCCWSALPLLHFPTSQPVLPGRWETVPGTSLVPTTHQPLPGTENHLQCHVIASLPILLTNIQPGTLLVKYIQVHVWEGKGGDNKA